MNAVSLICHPSAPCPHVSEASVRVDAVNEDLLVLYYQVIGDIDQLRLPAQTRSARASGLWKHTCFEAFIGAAGARTYFEFNLSPSSEWAVYRFDDYRQGMAPFEPSPPPKIICRRRADRLEADVDLHLAAFEELRGAELRLALCAVLQDLGRRNTHWALAHPPGKPDFHHPDSFAMTLAPRAGEVR